MARICVHLVTAKHSRLFDGENMGPFGDSIVKHISQLPV